MSWSCSPELRPKSLLEIIRLAKWTAHTATHILPHVLMAYSNRAFLAYAARHRISMVSDPKQNASK